MTEVMTDKDVPLDAPPSYTSATAIVPYRVPHAASSGKGDIVLFSFHPSADACICFAAWSSQYLFPII